jgi:hypothetical protein
MRRSSICVPRFRKVASSRSPRTSNTSSTSSQQRRLQQPPARPTRRRRQAPRMEQHQRLRRNHLPSSPRQLAWSPPCCIISTRAGKDKRCITGGSATHTPLSRCDRSTELRTPRQSTTTPVHRPPPLWHARTPLARASSIASTTMPPHSSPVHQHFLRPRHRIQSSYNIAHTRPLLSTRYLQPHDQRLCSNARAKQFSRAAAPNSITRTRSRAGALQLQLHGRRGRIRIDPDIDECSCCYCTSSYAPARARCLRMRSIANQQTQLQVIESALLCMRLGLR